MLREKLQARLKELAAALKAYSDKESLTAEELADMEAKTAEVAEVEKQLTALDNAEAAAARVAQPATAPAVTSEQERVAAEAKTKLITSHKIGLLATAMVATYVTDGVKGIRPVMKTLDEHGFGELAREIEAGNFVGGKQRTLNSSNATAGGVLLPENMAPDIIDLLRPNNTFLQGEPIVLPMPNGTFKQPAAAAGATASYRGETRPVNVSQPSFKAINMSAKLLGGIVPLSNQLIRWSLPNIQGWAENDLSAAMGNAMDLACFRGDGANDTPLGITRIPGVYRVAASGGTSPTVAQIEADAAKLELRMENANLPLLRVEWRMSPRTIKYLQNLRDGNGNRIYPELSAENPRWRMRPVRVTTQIPSNLGGTTDETEIYLVAFGHVLFGDSMAMQLAISGEATVVNGNQTINAFQDGVTVIKAEMEHDVDIRYVQAVNVLEGVRWGA
jgi:HK97 family phage major capsid protein